MADEEQREPESEKLKPWTIVGPEEMTPELEKQWEELKRTGVTPETWTGPPEDF